MQFFALKVLIKSFLEQLQLSNISRSMSHDTRHTGKTHVKRVANNLVRLAKTKQFMKPHELMSHTHTDVRRNFHGDILYLKFV